MKSRLMLSKPARRAAATASLAWAAVVQAVEHAQHGVVEALHAQAEAVDAQAAHRPQRFLADRTGVGLDGNLGVVCDGERGAAGGENARQVIAAQQRRRAAAEIDDVGLPRCGRGVVPPLPQGGVGSNRPISSHSAATYASTMCPRPA